MSGWPLNGSPHPGFGSYSSWPAAQAPPRSRAEMEALSAAADQVSVIPGRLGLHQEFGALLGQKLLATNGSAG